MPEIITPLDESKLADTQRLELEKVRLERLTAERALIESKERSTQVEAERLKLQAKLAVKDAFEQSPIKFYEDAMIENFARLEFDLRVDDGVATGLLNGKRVPLLAVLEQIARDKPYLADGRTTKHLRTDEPPAKAKSDLSRAEKIAFIEKFGLDAWEKLPMQSVQTKEIRTMQDFSSLPIPMKTALLAKHGLAWLEGLPRR
jgi:hypothetical protein